MQNTIQSLLKDFLVNKNNKTVVNFDTKAHDLVKGIHFDLFDGKLPNDWVYDTTLSILEKLTEYDHNTVEDLIDISHEIADYITDEDSHELMLWAVDFHNEIDEVTEESGVESTNLVQRVKIGQYLIIDNMVNYTVNFIEQNKVETE